MATERVINNQKITDMLQKMLQLGGTFVVDINRQVHYSISPDEPILLGDGKVKKKLYIYDTNIQDPTAVILNPLSETSVDNQERLLFYSSLSSVTSQWILRIVQYIVDECVRLKDNVDASTDPALVSTLTPFISKVDDKLVAELEKIRGNGWKDWATIYYNRMKKTSTLLMGIEDETGDYQKLFPNGNIRKRSWNIITDITKFVLKVPSDKKIKEVYTCTTEKVECPKFTTYSDVWVRIWECLNPYLHLFDGQMTDNDSIEALKEHFKNIPVYRECVTWLKQPAIPSTNALKAPNSNNVVTVTTTTPEKKEPSWKRSVTPSNIVNVTTTKQPSWMITNNSFMPGCNPGFGYGCGNIVNVRRTW